MEGKSLYIIIKITSMKFVGMPISLISFFLPNMANHIIKRPHKIKMMEKILYPIECHPFPHRLNDIVIIILTFKFQNEFFNLFASCMGISFVLIASFKSAFFQHPDGCKVILGCTGIKRADFYFRQKMEQCTCSDPFTPKLLPDPITHFRVTKLFKLENAACHTPIAEYGHFLNIPVR